MKTLKDTQEKKKKKKEMKDQEFLGKRKIL